VPRYFIWNSLFKNATLHTEYGEQDSSSTARIAYCFVYIDDVAVAGRTLVQLN
jgi:hypothetical protein